MASAVSVLYRSFRHERASLFGEKDARKGAFSDFRIFSFSDHAAYIPMEKTTASSMRIQLVMKREYMTDMTPTSTVSVSASARPSPTGMKSQAAWQLRANSPTRAREGEILPAAISAPMMPPRIWEMTAPGPRMADRPGMEQMMPSTRSPGMEPSRGWSSVEKKVPKPVPLMIPISMALTMERIPGSVKQMGKRGYTVMTQKEESLFQGKDIDAWAVYIMSRLYARFKYFVLANGECWFENGNDAFHVCVFEAPLYGFIIEYAEGRTEDKLGMAEDGDQYPLFDYDTPEEMLQAMCEEIEGNKSN